MGWDLGRLLRRRDGSSGGRGMPLASAHFAQARKTVRSAAGRAAGAANAPRPQPALEGALVDPTAGSSGCPDPTADEAESAVRD